jgi:hypothetical protein
MEVNVRFSFVSKWSVFSRPLVVGFGCPVTVGYVINGQEGASLQLIGAGINNFIGHASGFVASGFQQPRFENGGWNYDVFNDGRGLTIGSGLMVTPGDRWNQLHEANHLNQSILGPFYLAVHGPSFVANVLSGGQQGVYMEGFPMMEPDLEYGMG